jgi:hypothetical protein
MLTGAIGGAELVLRVGPAAALAAATAVMAVVTAAAARTTRTPGAWRWTTTRAPLNDTRTNLLISKEGRA